MQPHTPPHTPLSHGVFHENKWVHYPLWNSSALEHCRHNFISSSFHALIRTFWDLFCLPGPWMKTDRGWSRELYDMESLSLSLKGVVCARVCVFARAISTSMCASSIEFDPSVHVCDCWSLLYFPITMKLNGLGASHANVWLNACQWNFRAWVMPGPMPEEWKAFIKHWQYTIYLELCAEIWMYWAKCSNFQCAQYIEMPPTPNPKL